MLVRFVQHSPSKGIVCYGSELAAVKAGLQFDRPGGNFPFQSKHGGSSHLSQILTQETCRFDLDDLGGEVVLMDWTSGEVEIQNHQETRTAASTLRSRVTPLRGNEFLLPLTPDYADPIAEDISSIPRALYHIQENWKEGGLNRLTAWNLGRKLRERLTAQAAGLSKGGVDILLTGCEVSLWLAEQLASDLSKSFPKMAIQALSSNKLLGLLGQEVSALAEVPVKCRQPQHSARYAHPYSSFPFQVERPQHWISPVGSQSGLEAYDCHHCKPQWRNLCSAGHFQSFAECDSKHFCGVK